MRGVAVGDARVFAWWATGMPRRDITIPPGDWTVTLARLPGPDNGTILSGPSNAPPRLQSSSGQWRAILWGEPTPMTYWGGDKARTYGHFTVASPWVRSIGGDFTSPVLLAIVSDPALGPILKDWPL